MGYNTYLKGCKKMEGHYLIPNVLNQMAQLGKNQLPAGQLAGIEAARHAENDGIGNDPCGCPRHDGGRSDFFHTELRKKWTKGYALPYDVYYRPVSNWRDYGLSVPQSVYVYGQVDNDILLIRESTRLVVTAVLLAAFGN